MLATVKVTKCKSRPFEYALSIPKWPKGSVYIDNKIYHLTYLTDPFGRGLEIDLEESSIFLTLTLSMHINRLSLFYHF